MMQRYRIAFLKGERSRLSKHKKVMNFRRDQMGDMGRRDGKWNDFDHIILYPYSHDSQE